MYATTFNLGMILGLGAVVGVLGAVLGTGGGVFLIPILVLGFGVPMHYAVATSIVTVIATSTAVASANAGSGIANMRLGMTLEIPTTIGAILGGLSAAWFPAYALEGMFGVILLPVAILMWIGASGDEQASGGAAPPLGDDDEVYSGAPAAGMLSGRYFDEKEHRCISYEVKRLGMGLAISTAAGAVSGLLGVGGGIFKVPALHLACGIPIKAAAATSSFMVGVTAAASSFLYYGRGEVRPALTAAAVLGVIAGSTVGSRLNRRLEGGHVRRLFAVLLLYVAGQMLYRAYTG